MAKGKNKLTWVVSISCFILFLLVFFVSFLNIVVLPEQTPSKIIVEKPAEVVPEKTPEVPEVVPITPPSKVLFNVPFTAQAPFGNWADARQDYGCEEASLLMAVAWARDEKLTPEIALREILAMSEFEQIKFGDYHDTSAADTLELLKTYLDFPNAELKYDIKAIDIKNELAAGNVVVVPIDGIKVGNIYYTWPGPYRHQILVVGYDDATSEFITHDPGTMHGGNYRYSYKRLENALMDYPTGTNERVTEIRSAMIVVRK